MAHAKILGSHCQTDIVDMEDGGRGIVATFDDYEERLRQEKTLMDASEDILDFCFKWRQQMKNVRIVGIGHGDVDARRGRTCAQHVLCEVRGHRQMDQDPELWEKFWEDPLDFLHRIGYRPVVEPQQGDIVVYGNSLFPGGMRMGLPKHFGVVHGQRVHSKLSAGHVLEHDLDQTLRHYGNQAAILGQR